MTVEVKETNRHGEKMLLVGRGTGPEVRVSPRVFRNACRLAHIHFRVKEGSAIPESIQLKMREYVYQYLLDNVESQVPNIKLLPNPRVANNPKGETSVITKKIEKMLPEIFDPESGFVGKFKKREAIQKWRIKSAIMNLTNAILENAFQGEAEVLGVRVPFVVKDEDLTPSSFRYPKSATPEQKGLIDTLRYYRLFVVLLVINYLKPLLSAASAEVLLAEKTDVLKNFKTLDERGKMLSKAAVRRDFVKQCIEAFRPLGEVQKNSALARVFSGEGLITPEQMSLL